MAYFQILFWILTGGTEENTKSGFQADTVGIRTKIRPGYKCRLLSRDIRAQ